ncbi:MAG: hypothetical protein WA667_06380 [Candidatus Nitrosopolaris sp.]
MYTLSYGGIPFGQYFIIRVYGIIQGYNAMPQLKFIGRVSTMGDKLVIVIPKEFHKET